MIVNEIYFKGCYIKLKNSESDFLTEKLSKNSSLNSIKKSLVELHINSDVRYFDLNDINEISTNILSDFKRGYHNPKSVSDFIVKNEDVFLQNTGSTISTGICTTSGMYTINIKTGDKIDTLKFETEEEMNLYLPKLKVHNLK